MSDSCIRHPSKDGLVVVHRWMMAACEGDGCGATLLAHLLYHHSNKLANAPQARKMNDVAETHGEERTQFEGVYQWHTAKELEEGILGLYSARSIPKGLDRLEKLGFITISSNPNKKYKFDRTKYFFVHEEVIQAWVDEYVEAKKADKNAETLTQDTTGKSARRSSEIVNQPSNNVSQPCISARAITMTSSMTSSNDQEEKDTDEFFAIAPSSQDQENSFSVQNSDPNILDPQTPKPLSPATPENKPKPIVYDRMAERFADKGGSRKAQTMPLLDDNDFLRYLLTELRKTKSYFKDHPDKSKLAPAKEYIRKSWLLGAEGEIRFADLQEYVRDYEEHKASEAIAAQERQVEQQRFEQPIEDESERVDVSEVLANLKRKQALRKLQAA